MDEAGTKRQSRGSAWTASVPRSYRRVWDASFAEARAIDSGSWFALKFSSERIPTLTEVLELAKGAARVDIEFKYYGHDERLEERVVAIVEEVDMTSDVVIMSLKQQGVQKIRELLPDWTIGLLAATAIVDLTCADGDFWAVHSGLAVPRFINRAMRLVRAFTCGRLTIPFTCRGW